MNHISQNHTTKMATKSPSSNRDPNDVRSFMYGPGLRILLGAGAAYMARRLWTYNQDSLDSKLAELRSARTIPISSLHHSKISNKGDLVLIQNGVVSSLQEVLLVKSCGHAVMKRTLVYTDHPKEFEDVYKGMHEEKLTTVPFALKDTRFSQSKESFVVVKNVDADQLPLERVDRGSRTELYPPVVLIKKVSKKQKDESKHVANTEIRVRKAIEESVLKCGTELENVFGRIRVVDGVAQIEPCPNFPKKCFTMSKSEIKREVRARAREGLYPIRTCSVGVGLVSFGLLFSGFYSYAST